jgi:DNA-binding NtrC family response regulator
VTGKPAGGSDPLAELEERVAELTALLLDRGVGLEELLHALATRYAHAAMTRHGGSVSQAAAALGIHRNTLRAKLQRNGGSTRKR